MKKKIVLSVSLLALLVLVSFDSKSREVKRYKALERFDKQEDVSIDKSITLSVGVMDYSMPLCSSTLDDFSQRNGIYVDIAKNLAESMKKKLHVYYEKDYYFQRPLRKGILAGNCQVQMGIPDPKGKFIRKDKIIPSRPYMTLGYVLVLPKNSPVKKITDLKGRKVAFRNGSPPMNTIFKVEARYEPVTADELAMSLLNEEKVDAAFIWGPKAGYLNKFLYKNKFDVYSTPYQWDVVMGFSVKDERLRDRINSEILKLGKKINIWKKEYGIHYPRKMPISKDFL